MSAFDPKRTFGGSRLRPVTVVHHTPGRRGSARDHRGIGPRSAMKAETSLLARHRQGHTDRREELLAADIAGDHRLVIRHCCGLNSLVIAQRRRRYRRILVANVLSKLNFFRGSSLRCGNRLRFGPGSGDSPRFGFGPGSGDGPRPSSGLRLGDGPSVEALLFIARCRASSCQPS